MIFIPLEYNCVLNSALHKMFMNVLFKTGWISMLDFHPNLYQFLVTKFESASDEK